MQVGYVKPKNPAGHCAVMACRISGKAASVCAKLIKYLCHKAFLLDSLIKINLNTAGSNRFLTCKIIK